MNTFFKNSFGLLFIINTLVCCKKSDSAGELQPEPSVVTINATREQLTKDSIFLYSKELYYWNTSLPSYQVFDPRSYSSNQAELFALTQFSLNTETGRAYEYLSSNPTSPKYSYFDDASTEFSSAARLDLDGNETDFGFSVMYNTTTDLRVRYVYSGSAASSQGLSRGCRITAVNGRTDLSYSSGAVSFLNGAIFGDNPSIVLSFTDLNGSTRTATVSRTTYRVNPVLYTNSYLVGNKRIGYIVYNSFTSNRGGELNMALNTLAAQGITELIIDLRYNGGGYVSTATQMINSLGPSSQAGNVMFTTHYNALLQNLNTAQRASSVLRHQPLLDNDGNLQYFTRGVNGSYATYADLDFSASSADNTERFEKLGQLNLSRVYFLVSGSTASASELVINSLKPVMDVKLIGTTTYGKPVGFFPIRIDRLDMYIPEFETRNQSGTGGYYTGITPDREAYEDLSKAWGDQSDILLGFALLHSRTGSFVTTVPRSASLSAAPASFSQRLSVSALRSVSQSLDANNPRDMIMLPNRRNLH